MEDLTKSKVDMTFAQLLTKAPALRNELHRGLFVPRRRRIAEEEAQVAVAAEVSALDSLKLLNLIVLYRELTQN